MHGNGCIASAGGRARANSPRLRWSFHIAIPVRIIASGRGTRASALGSCVFCFWTGKVGESGKIFVVGSGDMHFVCTIGQVLVT